MGRMDGVVKLMPDVAPVDNNEKNTSGNKILLTPSIRSIDTSVSGFVFYYALEANMQRCHVYSTETRCALR